MPSTPLRPAAIAAAALVLTAALPASAQQARPDSGCTLTLQPTDSTRSVSRKTGPDRYITYLWNGMTWLCQPATMTADSAVQYESRGEVLMIGSVHYRDTIRDLRSRRLTYYQRDNRVLAEDSVRLRQLATGGVLRGPRVEFYNAVRGEGPQRTVATRRPRMTVPSPGDTAGEPFRVDADTSVFVGEEAAEAFGDVVIRRGDELTARAGYTRFRISDGAGFLTRSPSVEGEGYTLTGDTIRVRFVGSELRTVRARGNGHLETEDLEVRGSRVDVRILDERPEELWAYGEGDARAFSARQEIRGDSLHFDLATGRLREIAAVGRALALELLPGETASDRLAADTAPVRPGPTPDTTRAAAPPTRPAETVPGEAPAPDSAVTDSVAREAPPPDSAAADSVAPAPGRGAGQGAPSPGLDRNWITGDTVRARFTAAGPDTAAADSVAADTAAAPVPADTPAAARDTAAAGPDSAASPPDSAANELERLVATGNARSFYRIRRDSAETGGGPPGPAPGEGPGGTTPGDRRMARNYVIGDRITIRFLAGEPLSVQGTRAIGVFLEPVETEGPAAPDSLAPGDSLPAGEAAPAPATGDSARRDTAAAPPVAPDTAADRSPELRGDRPDRPPGRRGPDRGAEPLRDDPSGTLPSMPGIRRTGGMIYE